MHLKSKKSTKDKTEWGNTIKAIDTWAIPLIQYTTGIIDWTQAELYNWD